MGDGNGRSDEVLESLTLDDILVLVTIMCARSSLNI